MTSPTEYIESRKTALYQYIGTYGMKASDLNTETTSYISALRLFKGIPIMMRTTDSLYQMARQITGITIPVKGEQYDQWHENVLNYIVRYKQQQKMKTRDIANITGMHENNYKKIATRNITITGRTLWKYYENLKKYQQL